MDERRILDGLTGAVLALVFVVAPPLLAESIGHDEQGANLPGGRVFHSGGIVNRASGKALDVRDQSTHDGAAIQQWDFSASQIRCGASSNRAAACMPLSAWPLGSRST